MTELKDIDSILHEAEMADRLNHAIENYIDGIEELIDMFQDTPSAPIENRITLHVKRLMERCFKSLNEAETYDETEASSLWKAYLFFKEYDFLDLETEKIYMQRLWAACDSDILTANLYELVSKEALFVVPVFGNKSLKEQGKTIDDLLAAQQTEISQPKKTLSLKGGTLSLKAISQKK